MLNGDALEARIIESSVTIQSLTRITIIIVIIAVGTIHTATATTKAEATAPSSTHSSVVIELGGIRRGVVSQVRKESFLNLSIMYSLGIFLYNQKSTEHISHFAFLFPQKIYIKKRIIAILFYVIRSPLTSVPSNRS